jgi:signal peptidase I
MKTSHRSAFVENVMTIVYAILIAAVVRTVAFQPFNIPSESMVPTLLVGDYLLVSKFSYGYSRYSLPFGLPLFQGRILGHEPERGDVAVFKLPADNSTDYIKRIIGLPGDRIQMIDGVLHLNGEPVKREKVEDFVYTDRFGSLLRVPQYLETLPNGRSYHTLARDPSNPANNTGVYTVPPGHVFAMGDNRDNSRDSRFLGEVGFIPMENLVGPAEIRFFSTDGSASLFEPWAWFSAARWSRFFTTVN